MRGMSDLFDFKEYTEDLSLIINARQSKVSTKDLINYLANYEQLVKSLNCALNSKYSIGYEMIQVDIEGLKEGSFEIKSKLKKLAETTGEILLGIFLTQLLSNDPTPVVININGDNVTVNVTDLIKDKGVVKYRSRIARTANNDTEVDGIAIEMETKTGAKEKVTISRETLSGIIVDDEDTSETESNWLHNATMVIVAPVLESEQAFWKVRIGDRKLSAKMTDDLFLTSMNNEKIAFGKGDSIVADLESVITKKEGSTPTTKYYIRKVYRYPKYPQETTLHLFEAE